MELGKVDPVTSGEEVFCYGASPERRSEEAQTTVEQKTGLCKAVRRSIGADACPVLEVKRSA